MIQVTLLSVDVVPKSGWGVMTHGVCTALSRRSDVRFRLLLPVNAPVEGSLPFADAVRRVLPPWKGSFRWRPYELIPFISPSISCGDTDIVHSLIEFPYGILARGLARRAGAPYAISMQGTYGVAPFRSWVDRWAYRGAVRTAAFVTAPSQFTARAMRTASGVSRDVQVIHNPVNHGRFQRPSNLRALRQRFAIPGDARVILGVGALKPRKGFDILVQAFAHLVASVPMAHLVIVGEGPEESALLLLAERLGVPDRFHLLGPVNEDDLTGLYQTCEIYCHLPREVNSNFEGFGLVFLEAGACGKPVVATRSGGVPEAVHHGETGLLVEEEDAAGAADAFRRLFADPELATRLGDHGRDWAAHHSWEWYAGQMLELYQSAIDVGASRRSAHARRRARPWLRFFGSQTRGYQ